MIAHRARSPRASGRTHEPRAELLGIYEKYNLATEFPPRSSARPPPCPTASIPRDRANRLDYREVPTFTIDPDDAKDFDDALSYETSTGDETRVGVHIADVSAYVRPPARSIARPSAAATPPTWSAP
jgi:ribonuclease R